LNGNLGLVRYLVEQGADIHSIGNDALINAFFNNHFEVGKYLLSQGADINANNNYILISSARKGDLEIVKYLVIDCNMIIKEETLNYLKENFLIDALNIIKSRDFHDALNNNLTNDMLNKAKLKINKL
jgi:ankyrin repeat protein